MTVVYLAIFLLLFGSVSLVQHLRRRSRRKRIAGMRVEHLYSKRNAA